MEVRHGFATAVTQTVIGFVCTPEHLHTYLQAPFRAFLRKIFTDEEIEILQGRLRQTRLKVFFPFARLGRIQFFLLTVTPAASYKTKTRPLCRSIITALTLNFLRNPNIQGQICFFTLPDRIPTTIKKSFDASGEHDHFFEFLTVASFAISVSLIFGFGQFSNLCPWAADLTMVTPRLSFAMPSVIVCPFESLIVTNNLFFDIL